MKKMGSILPGFMFMVVICPQAGAASYRFSQTYEGVTKSGTFTVVNDTFRNPDDGYTANSTTTSALLADLSLPF